MADNSAEQPSIQQTLMQDDCRTDNADQAELKFSDELRESRNEDNEDQQILEKSGDLPGPRPPDGGYGWVVVFASFMIQVLGACADSYGVFYMHLLEDFGAGNSLTAWPGAICIGLSLMGGPLASWLCQRFSHRVCCILGAVVGTMGLLSSAFVTNIYLMIITYGVVAGIGFCLQYLSAGVIVGYYFDKRRTLAICIGLCGTCIGGFVIPPLLEILTQYYHWRGAMTIAAGISLHACVFAALFTPPPTIESKEGSQSCDVQILTDYRLLLFCVAECSWDFGNSVFYTIVAEFAHFEGNTREQGTWMLSAMSGASAVSRILAAVFAGHPKCDRVLLYGVSVALSIVPLALFPYTQLYGLYILYSVMYGIAGGVILGLSVVIMADLFGMEKITSAYGYVILFDGVTVTAGPPIAGRFFDLTGSYEVSWLVCAACTFIGAVACFILVITNRYHQRNQSSNRSLNHTDTAANNRV